MIEAIKELALEYCAIEDEKLKLRERQLELEARLREAIESRADSVESYDAYFDAGDAVVSVLLNSMNELFVGKSSLLIGLSRSKVNGDK